MADVYLSASGVADYPEATRKDRPYIVDKATSGTTYICFTNEAKRVIHRIVEANSVTTTTYSYGAWDDRASLTYFPINEAHQLSDFE